MSIENVFDNIRPWVATYSPWRANDNAEVPGAEIPAWEVHDAEGEKVCDTDENRPADLQERYANAIAAVPTMIYALRMAQLALNTAPSFIVDRERRITSYTVASIVDKVLKKAGEPWNKAETP